MVITKEPQNTSVEVNATLKNVFDKIKDKINDPAKAYSLLITSNAGIPFHVGWTVQDTTAPLIGATAAYHRVIVFSNNVLNLATSGVSDILSVEIAEVVFYDNSISG